MTKPLLRSVVLTASVDAANGTGKPVPYKVRRKTQHRTGVTRNVKVSTDVPNRATRDNRIRRCVNAPLKKRL